MVGEGAREDFPCYFAFPGRGGAQPSGLYTHVSTTSTQCYVRAIEGSGGGYENRHVISDVKILQPQVAEPGDSDISMSLASRERQGTSLRTASYYTLSFPYPRAHHNEPNHGKNEQNCRRAS